ncbi:hypothetical protein PQX77_003351 [Marasmius sp. AFHP31]|nr:hypothetical protein PQX77_003351 [Marasmius sp. AFHP31]
MASKRPRLPLDSSSDSSQSPPSSPILKSSRTVSGAGAHQLLCSLPPTCNHRPTYLANSKDLETHYATYHAHVCEQRGCSCVFPEARFLELHQTECHDPIAALRKDRGERIFSCFVTSCTRRFATPKGRRLHLIQAHGYPKEYYFHVTVLGVGGLLKRWGEGASMIQEWKPRGSIVKDTTDAKDQDDGKGEESNVSDHLVDDTSDDGNESDATERQSANGYATKIKDNGAHSDADDGHISDRDGDTDKLAESMSSLSLVPGSIRFGRGSVKVGFSPAHNGGHMNRGRGRGGRGRARGFNPNADHSVPKGANSEGPGMEIDSSATGYNNHRGRGAYRGRVGPGPMNVPASVTFGRGGIAARRGLRPRGRGA